MVIKEEDWSLMRDNAVRHAAVVNAVVDATCNGTKSVSVTQLLKSVSNINF